VTWITIGNIDLGNLIIVAIIALSSITFYTVAMNLDGGKPMLANIAANLAVGLAIIAGGQV
jgi:hypothetical protein